MNDSHSGKKPDIESVAALPGWKVIFAMIRFRPLYWFLDLCSVSLFRFCWQVIPALVIQLFFDMITGERQVAFGIWTVLAFAMSTWLGRMIGGFGFYKIDVPLFADIMTLLRKNLLTHILRRPGAATLPDSSGEAVSRFRNDVEEIPMFVILINDILVGTLIISGSIVMMAAIDPLVTVAGLLPVLVSGIVANLATHRIEHYRAESRIAGGKVTGFIGEFFGAVQAVKAANAERDVLGRFAELNAARKKMAVRERLFDDILGSVYRNTSVLGTGIILVVVGRSMASGAFTIGDFSLFVYLLSSMGGLTTFAGMLAAQYKKMGVSVNRMYRLMEGAPINALVEHSHVDLEGELPAVIYPERTQADRLDTLTAENLSYAYPGSANGVFGINLAIKRGTFTVITGRVGSGKTTLVRVLLGLLPSDAGTVSWNGKVLESPGDFLVPPRCAYTGQVPRLFSATLRDNILLGMAAGDDVVYEAAGRAVMESDLEIMERNLDTMIGARGVKLSGGQAQRTAAARMFVRDPELLVFDDLSSALDVETERKLWDRVFSLEGKTSLVVSHRKAAFERADRIIVLKDGKVEDEGTYAELVARCPEMKELTSGGYQLRDFQAVRGRADDTAGPS